MLRAAEDGPVVCVLAVDGCELTRRLRVIDSAAAVILMSSDDDAALQDAPAPCGAAVFMPKDRFGRRMLASTWAQFAEGRSC